MLWQSVSSSKHFQGKYIFKGVTTAKAQTAARTMTIKSQNKQHCIAAVSDSRLAAERKPRRLTDEKESESDCCVSCQYIFSRKMLIFTLYRECNKIRKPDIPTSTEK